MRVGVVAYANTRPLAHGLERHLPGATVVRATPAAIADGLHDGTLDVGTVPVAALAEHPHWTVVPGLGIASEGPVRSVLLLARTRPEAIRSLVLDPASRTSNLLARLWLRHVVGAEPEVLPGPPAAVDRLEVGDATVAIGDDALFFNRRVETAVDLGGAWTEWTGLPFVFAVWAGPRAESPALAVAFEACYGENEARLEELAALEAEGDGIRREILRSYYRNSIRYRLGPRESRGLARYLALGAEAGYLAPAAEGASHVHVG